MRKILILLNILLCSSFSVFAQAQNQRAWIPKPGAEDSKPMKVRRAEAESIAVKNNLPIRTEYSNGRIIELQYFEDGYPIYYQTDNLTAAATVGSDKVWKDNSGGYSLSGKNVTLGIWDGGGIRTSHQEFNSRVTQKDNPSALSDHSTHVSGTMIAFGVDPAAKGMSSDAKLNAYDWTSDLTELQNEALKGLKASNHSYGNIIGWAENYKSDGKWAWFGDTTFSKTEDYNFGLYTSTSYSWDLALFNYPYYLVCKSAGNNRGEGAAAGAEHWLRLSNGSFVLSTLTHEKDGGPDGYGCLEAKAVGKNLLTVAAVNGIANGYTKPSDVVMSSFSDWGPTDDGRIKPDISADGVSLYSTTSTGDKAYVKMSGTSMATPNTTGSIGLILEHQNNLHPDTAMFAATIKALVIHTANEAGANPGPDYAFGWGLLNTLGAVNLMTLNAQLPGNQLIKELTLNQNEKYDYQVTTNGKEPLKVTICWTDWPGNPPLKSLNPTDLMLVNDLDLRIIGPNGTYMPWVLDPANPSKAAITADNFRDNVEQVLISAPVAGTYTIRVAHKATLFQEKQNFSMIISGITLPDPEAPELSSPSNGLIEQNSNMKFVWKLSPKSTQYQLQVALDSLFTKIVIDTPSVNGVIANISNLPGLSDIYWRVRGVNNRSSSAWSNIWKFKTKVSIPVAPVLLEPANGAVRVPVKDFNIKWSAVAIATSYNLKVNAGPFTAINAPNLTDTFYKVTNALGDGKKHTWSTNSVNSSGGSAYSASWSFTTILLAPDSLKAVNIAPKKVSLSWVDKSANEQTYYILRKKSSDVNYSAIDSIASNSTAYTDSTVEANINYLYKVYCINSVASSDSSNEVSIKPVTAVSGSNSILPQEYSLSQNFPNPFNPKTTIKYALPFESEVKLAVYNLLGEVVKELVSGVQNPGFHEVDFDASSISSGVYLYRISARSLHNSKEFREVKKLILMK